MIPEIQKVATEFNTADRNAKSAQRSHKLLTKLAIILRLVAIIAGVVAMVPATLDAASEAVIPAVWPLAAVAVQYLALSASILCSLMVAHLDLLRKWMEQRAQAEKLRIDFFDRVIGCEEDAREDERTPLLLQFEYFRRHMLDAQCAYFARKGEIHRRWAMRTRSAIRWMTVFVVVSLAPVVWATLELLGLRIVDSQSVNPMFLALGTLAAAGLSALDSISRVNLDARNASKYRRLSDSIRKICDDRLPATLEAAEKNDRAMVRDFVNAFGREIEAEYREWMLIRNEFRRQSANEPS